MSDLISRQAAIEWVENILEIDKYYHPHAKSRNVPIDEVIDRLKRVPSAQPKSSESKRDLSDTISRHAALDALDTWDKFGCDPDGRLVRYDDDKHYVPYVHYDDMVHAIKNLPSVQETHDKCTETHACDLIDRRAAISVIAKWMLEYGGEGEERERNALKQAAEEIKELPSAQPEQRWIPVTERLPEEDLCTGYGRQYSESVLITAHNMIDDEDIVDYGHTVDGRWFSDTTDAYIPDNWIVTAWQKLPEPYKGEEE